MDLRELFKKHILSEKGLTVERAANVLLGCTSAGLARWLDKPSKNITERVLEVLEKEGVVCIKCENDET